MLFRSLIGPAMVGSASMPSPVLRIVTVPKSNMRPNTDCFDGQHVELS